MTGRFGALRRFFISYGFLVAAATLVVTELWLTSEIRIIPSFAPHDMSNFVEHARSLGAGLWFGGYDDLTLIKRPFFPIFLAGLQEFGVALPIGHTLLYAGACLVACTAVRPAIKSQTLRAVAFGVLLFNPFTYNNNAWIANRSQINPALALLVVACGVAIFVRRDGVKEIVMPWSIGLGLVLAAFWLTREEAIWIFPTVLILLGGFVTATVRTKRPDWRSRTLVVVAYPLLILAVSVAFVMAANGIRYGWYVVEEQQAPEFVSAYNSLARIDVPPVPFVGVPKAAREIAYSISPAAKELEGPLEGPAIGRWKSLSCRPPEMVCGTDFSRGYFVWAFRDAVSVAGHYTSGAAARTYYLQLAKEIDAACDARRIACLPKALSLTPPIHLSDLPLLGTNFATGARLLITFANIGLEPPRYPDPPPQTLSDYGIVVRSVADFPQTVSFNGWLAHESMKRITVKADDGSETPLQFLASPDVEHALSTNGSATERAAASRMNAGKARFQITVRCMTCAIVATDSHDVVTTIPLTSEQPDFRDSELLLHLDTSTPTSPFRSGDDRFKNHLLHIIAIIYSTLVPSCILAGLTISLFRAIQSSLRRGGVYADHALVTLAIACSCGALLLILDVVSTFSYLSFYPEYMSPLYPLVLFAFTFTIAVEVSHVRARAISRSGARSTGLSSV